MNCKLKLHSQGFYWKILRVLHALEDLLVEPLFKIFYTFVCKKVREITITDHADKYMEKLKQASSEIQSAGTERQIFF